MNDKSSRVIPWLLFSSKKLGFWNPAGSHPVGIYDSNGVLLVSTTVSLSDPQSGAWYFHSLDVPFVLQPGENYELVTVNGSASYTHTAYINDFTVNSGIQWVGGGVAGVNFDGQLHYGTINGSSGGYLGPNFRFTTVPEPGFIALLLIGLGSMGCLFARRSRK